MLTIAKLLKSLLKIVNSQAAPWQVFLGTLFGCLLGFLPVFPIAHGPALLGLCILLLAIVINCHFASVLMFFALCKLLSLVLGGPAVAVGEQFSGLAKASADIPFLYHSLWSHTGYLGLTLIGLCAAPLLAILMTRFTVIFRARLREKLLAQKKLATAGKIVGNTLVLRVTCWFFDL